MTTLTEVTPAFVDMTHRIVWATVDAGEGPERLRSSRSRAEPFRAAASSTGMAA